MINAKIKIEIKTGEGLEVGEANKVVLDVDIDDDGKGCEASGANYIHDQIECRQVLQCFHISCMSPKKVW